MSTDTLKITPGEALVSDGSTIYILNSDGSNRISAQVQRGWETEWRGGGTRTTNQEVRAVAALYADAHNTFNRTGKIPSQLAERLEEAERLLGHVLGVLKALPGNTVIGFDGVMTIKRATQFLTPPTPAKANEPLVTDDQLEAMADRLGPRSRNGARYAMTDLRVLYEQDRAKLLADLAAMRALVRVLVDQIDVIEDNAARLHPGLSYEKALKYIDDRGIAYNKAMDAAKEQGFVPTTDALTPPR